jgi:hypothetical protein
VYLMMMVEDQTLHSGRDFVSSISSIRMEIIVQNDLTSMVLSISILLCVDIIKILFSYLT